MVLYLARKCANRPIDYSYAIVRRDTFHLKLEAIEHLQHSINILNDRIGPEDLTEDEISEAVDILLNAGDEPVPPMEPQRMHSSDVGAILKLFFPIQFQICSGFGFPVRTMPMKDWQRLITSQIKSARTLGQDKFT